ASLSLAGARLDIGPGSLRGIFGRWGAHARGAATDLPTRARGPSLSDRRRGSLGDEVSGPFGLNHFRLAAEGEHPLPQPTLRIPGDVHFRPAVFERADVLAKALAYIRSGRRGETHLHFLGGPGGVGDHRPSAVAALEGRVGNPQIANPVEAKEALIL